MIRHSHASAVLVLALHALATDARADGLAGPWRGSANFGYPELIGVGVGRTFGDGGFRGHLDVGTIVLVSSVDAHLQRLILRRGWFVLAAGVHGGFVYDPRLMDEDPQPRKSWVGGARLSIELGGARGLGFALDAGAMAWSNGKLRGADAGTWTPSFTLRLFYAWGP